MDTKSAEILGARIPGFSKTWAVVLIILGLIALALPFEAGVAVAIAVAILVLAAGVIHLFSAFTVRTAGAFFWRVLVGILFLVIGAYLLEHPKLSLISITLFLAILFLVEGIFHLATYFQLRKLPGASWLLFDGIVTLILAFLIWRNWPVSAVWAVGTIFGIDLLVTGFTRLMYSSSAGRAAIV